MQAYLASYRKSLRNRTDPPGQCTQGHQMRREPSGRPVCDICKSNRRKEARESDTASAERERLRMRQHRARWRDEALSILGRACVCCGQTRQVFLHIDHTDNDGHEHRRTAGIRGGAAMNRWVIAHPAEARQRCQVLCANCNMAKAIEENHQCPPKVTP